MTHPTIHSSHKRYPPLSHYALIILGFLHVWLSVADTIMSLVAQALDINPTYTMHVTGHSLVWYSILCIVLCVHFYPSSPTPTARVQPLLTLPRSGSRFYASLNTARIHTFQTSYPDILVNHLTFGEPRVGNPAVCPWLRVHRPH